MTNIYLFLLKSLTYLKYKRHEGMKNNFIKLDELSVIPATILQAGINSLPESPLALDLEALVPLDPKELTDNVSPISAAIPPAGIAYCFLKR